MEGGPTQAQEDGGKADVDLLTYYLFIYLCFIYLFCIYVYLLCSFFV